MNQKLRNTFFKAAEIMFNLPAGNYSCHSINKALGRRISDCPDERAMYENLFLCEFRPFRSHFESSFSNEADRMTPDEIDSELKEVRVLALLFAGHILSDDLHTKRLDEEERRRKMFAFQNAVDFLSNRVTEFSCIALKLSVWERDGQQGFPCPPERMFYENLFDCKYKTFDALLNEHFPKESDRNTTYKYLEETRMLALLLAGEVYADQQ